MTGRDRIVVIVLAALAVLAAGWLLVVSPERKKAEEVEAKVSAAQTSLKDAEAKLSEAKSAQSRFASAYSTIVSLGEAVPAGEQVPSLVYELDHASGHDKVEFQSIAAGGSGTSAAASTPAASTASAAGFKQLPFTFTFDGSFFDLYKLIDKLQGFTVGERSGAVKVSGRLLTIQGVSLTVSEGSSSGAAGSKQGSKPGSAGSGSVEGQKLTGTVTATAYVLPSGQALTAGATPSGFEGTQVSASGPSSSGSPTAPALVKAPTP